MDLPVFSHRLYGERFYSLVLGVPRLSNHVDRLPVTISERLLTFGIQKGMPLRVQGQLRSYNKIVEGQNRLILTVFARQIQAVEPSARAQNLVVMTGHLCKEPVYRTTPFMREITDLLLAVNRAYGKSDYIPVIAWGRAARFARLLRVGDRVCVEGRFQSRDYQKRQGDGRVEERVAFEVSAVGLESAKPI
jgi:single-stranded DNA-binding protein